MTDDCMRHLKFLHDITELYTRSIPSLASWFGLQFVERACVNGIEISKCTAQTLCPQCGVINIPGLTRNAASTQKLRNRKNVKPYSQVCTHCQYVFASNTAQECINLNRNNQIVSGDPKQDLASDSLTSLKRTGHAKTEVLTKKSAKRSTITQFQKNASKSTDGSVPSKRLSLVKKKTTLTKLLSLQKQNEKKTSKPFTLSDFLSNL